MATKITDSMLITAAGSYTPEAVGKVRRILADAGVTDVELHRFEIDALRKYREQARAATAAADRYLASGPLPDHGCIVDDAGIVVDAGNCPFGCRPKASRLDVE